MLKPISQHFVLPSISATSKSHVTPMVAPSTTASGEPEEDDFKAHAIILRSKRQEVLASNIANVDTPNYRALDLDFQSSLKQAVTRQQSKAGAPGELRQTNNGHLPPLPSISYNSTVSLVYRMPMQSGLDNNSVDMDVERGQIADNAIRFQLALQAYEDEFKEFRAAS